MAPTYAQGFILLLIASSWVSSIAARKFIVGGSQKWAYGVNYTDWVAKNEPFHISDSLVFRYNPPNNTPPHNVFLIPTLSNFKKCNVTGATKIANESQGAGDGFEFVLEQKKAYYFACGVGGGHHCYDGDMKLSVTPS